MTQDSGLAGRRRLKDLVVNLGLALFGIALAVIAAELIARAFVPAYMTMPHPKGLYRNDPDLGYVLSEGFQGRLQHAEYDVAVAINAGGLRGPEIIKSPGAFRILVLGDSIAWGYGVEYEASFPRQLEERLQALDGEIQVINGAVPGYGTDQELEFLRKVGLQYAPDLIVVGLFVENDIYDNLIGGAGYRKVQDGYLIDAYKYEQQRAENPLIAVTAFLSRKSRLYVLLRSYLRDLLFRAERGSPEFRVENLAGLSGQQYLPVFARDQSPEIAAGMDLTAHLLEDIADTAAAHGASTLVVLFPSKIQVDAELWQEIQEVYHLDSAAYTLSKPDEMLVDACSRSGIPVLDLLPAFRAAGVDTDLYFRTDLHQNPEGQALAADVVYHELVTRGMVP